MANDHGADFFLFANTIQYNIIYKDWVLKSTLYLKDYINISYICI